MTIPTQEELHENAIPLLTYEDINISKYNAYWYKGNIYKLIYGKFRLMQMYNKSSYRLQTRENGDYDHIMINKVILENSLQKQDQEQEQDQEEEQEQEYDNEEYDNEIEHTQEEIRANAVPLQYYEGRDVRSWHLYWYDHALYWRLGDRFIKKKLINRTSYQATHRYGRKTKNIRIKRIVLQKEFDKYKQQHDNDDHTEQTDQEQTDTEDQEPVLPSSDNEPLRVHVPRNANGEIVPLQLKHISKSDQAMKHMQRKWLMALYLKQMMEATGVTMDMLERTSLSRRYDSDDSD